MADENEWHLDKRVPIALIAALAVQTLSVGLWAGGVQHRLTSLEAAISQQAEQNARLIRVEEKLAAVNEKLDRIYERDRDR